MAHHRPLILATRGSALAIAQAESVRERLDAVQPEVEVRLRIVHTAGDRPSPDPPPSLGSRGLFTADIERLLLGGGADLAVHSLKDLPIEGPQGLVIAAVPARADPRDALISASGAGLMALPAGTVVGSSSLRRQAQLLLARPDLRFHPLRGNVDSRLRALDEGRAGVGAIVVAAAGLARLGLGERVTEALEPEICLPAPGQGALAVQARADDRALIELLAPLDCPGTRFCVTVERSLLGALGGGCRAPVGALARLQGPVCVAEAVICEPCGAWAIRQRLESTEADPVAVGRTLAEMLRADGAGVHL